MSQRTLITKSLTASIILAVFCWSSGYSRNAFGKQGGVLVAPLSLTDTTCRIESRSAIGNPNGSRITPADLMVVVGRNPRIAPDEEHIRELTSAKRALPRKQRKLPPKPRETDPPLPTSVLDEDETCPPQEYQGI
jgi:hypothetical protein